MIEILIQSKLNKALHRLIAHSTVRFTTLTQLKAHAFFTGVPWDSLRDRNAPFVPALDSEIDTGYYDDFTSLEDMAKYAEVKEKQKNVERVKEKEEPFGRGVWVGFTFGKNNAAGQAAARLTAQRSIADDDNGSFATIF